jgi:hypothetical protein
LHTNLRVKVYLTNSRSKLMMLELLHLLGHYLIMHHLIRKAGSVSKVTEDLSLENLRQELEVEKAWTSLRLLSEASANKKQHFPTISGFSCLSIWGERSCPFHCKGVQICYLSNYSYFWGTRTQRSCPSQINRQDSYRTQRNRIRVLGQRTWNSSLTHAVSFWHLLRAGDEVKLILFLLLILSLDSLKTSLRLLCLRTQLDQRHPS